MVHETLTQIQPPPTRDTDVQPDTLSVVYFGNDWSAENRTSSHHIARLLGERLPLLYVDSPGMRSPAATGRDIRKLWCKLRQAFQSPKLVHSHMWVMTMPQIPFRRFPLIGRLNKLYGRYVVKRAIRKLGLRRVLLWFAVPHPGALAGCLGEQCVVYYCIDNYAGLPDVDGREIARLDDDLTRSADLVFASATPLVESKRRSNPATLYSPHGVDFAHFHRASDISLPVPEDARYLRHPIVGMFGSLRSWIDTDLIVYLATTHPEWTFLLIGLATVDLSSLRRCPNVVLAGPQPYEKLPDWARVFDVTILPFRQNEGTRYANPLKLREYLATGKPVVAVSTPEIDRFAHCIRIAHSPGEFAKEIEDALTRDTEEEKRARIAAVMGCTWEARVDEVLNTVQDAYQKKARRASAMAAAE